ncbi:MAG: IPTL-CTERM sorting domain-containing protein, partial [Planctomycetes bacterium]|nr:IPTL-CTERM sorting domain-containing protein [Planctomycetota bacterium]
MLPVMIVKPEGDVRDLTVDPIARKLYWIDWIVDAPRNMRSADLDGSNVVDILSGLGPNPLSLAVHPTNGDLYWVDWGSGPSGTDGSVRRSIAPQFSSIEILVTDLHNPGVIAFGVAGQEIYFVENGRTVWRSALNGTGLETAFTIEGNATTPILVVALTTVAVATCQPGSFSVTGGEPCMPCACEDFNGCTTNECDPVAGACQNEPIAGCTVPTVSQWGLIMLSLLMGTAGTLILRRRHQCYA